MDPYHGIFDVRFCQFELDQWMDACGPLPLVLRQGTKNAIEEKVWPLKNCQK